jgi:uncharacterized membrane protein
VFSFNLTIIYYKILVLKCVEIKSKHRNSIQKKCDKIFTMKYKNIENSKSIVEIVKNNNLPQGPFKGQEKHIIYMFSKCAETRKIFSIEDANVLKPGCKMLQNRQPLYQIIIQKVILNTLIFDSAVKLPISFSVLAF